MKHLVGLTALALAATACSEATAPDASLEARYAKPTGPAPIVVNGDLTLDTFGFEDNSISGAAGTSWAMDDLETGGIDIAAPGIVTAYNSFTKFLGRVDNHSLFLIVPNGGSKWSAEFDLYIIGSWDGQGKQAQNGAFGQDIWRFAIRCSVAAAPAQVVLETDFSNQQTVQQSYPGWASKQAGNKAALGSYATDLLGYKDDPAVHTPQFRSYGDAAYRMSFSGTNPCGAGNPMILAFTVPNAGLQSNYDESWGLDNVVIKTDS